MSHSILADSSREEVRTSTQKASHSSLNGWWVCALAEGISTFCLVFVGRGAIMVNSESHGQITHVDVELVFVLIITVMIYAFGHISGAHFNPARTLAFIVARHFPVRRLWVYWNAQLVGTCFSALCLCLCLLPGNVADPGTTFPAGYGGIWQSFAFEALLPFFLLVVIMAMATDTRAVGQATALAIGATVALDALFAGPISGASMNPVRSPGSALMSGTWSAQWVYLIAPFLGANVGALMYRWIREAGKLPPSIFAQEDHHD